MQKYRFYTNSLQAKSRSIYCTLILALVFGRKYSCWITYYIFPFIFSSFAKKYVEILRDQLRKSNSFPRNGSNEKSIGGLWICSDIKSWISYIYIELLGEECGSSFAPFFKWFFAYSFNSSLLNIVFYILLYKNFYCFRIYNTYSTHIFWNKTLIQCFNRFHRFSYLSIQFRFKYRIWYIFV